MGERYLLSCGHSTPYGTGREEALCPRCILVRDVVGLALEWSAKCRECTYARKTGQARMEAVGRARRHVARTGHRVDIYDERGSVYHTFGRPSTEPLF